MIALLLAASSALAQSTPDYRSHLDQAQLFLRRGYLADALIELNAAVGHPDGQHDPEAWFMLATTRLRTADVAGASEAVRHAQTNARDTDQAEQAEALAAYLASAFGTIEVVAPAPGVTARVDLTLQSLVLDARAQEIASALRDQAHTRSPLPRRFTVPAGDWTVNGKPVTVTANETTTVMHRPGLGAAVLGLANAEVGVGLGALAGPAVGPRWPGPQTHVALAWHIGPFEAAVTATWAPQRFIRRDGSAALGAGAGSVGGRLGVAAPGLAPWFLRPALTLQRVWVPGISLACLSSGTEELRCTQSGDADLLLYATGRAWAPGVHLSVGRVDETLSSDVGLSLQLGAQRLRGSVPTRGDAVTTAGDTLAWLVPETSRRWSASAWTVGLHVVVSL